jgi:hypothetical protein
MQGHGSQATIRRPKNLPKCPADDGRPESRRTRFVTETERYLRDPAELYPQRHSQREWDGSLLLVKKMAAQGKLQT